MDYEVELVELSEQPTAAVSGDVEHDGIPGFLGHAFGEVMGLLARQGLQPVGPPFARYRATDDGGWHIEAGFPVGGTPTADGRVQPMSLPGGRAARTTHVGDYAELSAAYEAVTGWLTEHGYAVAGDPWECYLDGPEVAHPRTQVVFPCHEASPR